MTRRRQLILAGAVLAGIGVLFLTRHRVSGALTLLEAIGAPSPRPFAPDTQPEMAEVGGVSGLLLDGGGSAILIVPGAVPAGLDDPRVRDVARSLSRAGRAVFVPDLDLYGEQFTEADLERIVDAVGGLAELTGGRVAVTGFSYGGSFALVAAADPRMEGRLSRMATLGAYYDLVGVVQAITTGGSLVDGEFLQWEGDPRAEKVLAERTAEFLPADDQAQLHAALEGEIGPEQLTVDARSLYDLLVDEDPTKTGELVMGLPADMRSMFETFSPAEVADDINVPVLAMHDWDDPVVPYGELLRLKAGMPGAEVATVEIFQHVDFSPTNPGGWWSLAPDMWKVWGFTTWILGG